jgi:hypothetical protein
MRKFYFLIVPIMLGILSCSNPETKQTTTEEVPAIQKPAYSPMPTEKWNYFVANCSSLDISFYSLGFSMSATSCSQMLPLIETSAPVALEGEEFGHILFLVQGEKFSIAKIVLSRQNNYLKFEFDDAVYYHNLNQKGIEYFANIKAQVEAQMQQKP